MGEEVRPVGLTKDVGWQVGARKTIPMIAEDAWNLIQSQAGLAIWLGPLDVIGKGDDFEFDDGVTGKIRVNKPGSHMRLAWKLPAWERASTLQVRVVDRGDRSVIAFHQENLPDQNARKLRRAHFKQALDDLAALADKQGLLMPKSD